MAEGARFRLTPELAGIALALSAQTAGIVWWASKIDDRVAHVEAQALSDSNNATVIARLDERTNALVTTVDRIDQRMNTQEDERRRSQP